MILLTVFPTLLKRRTTAALLKAPVFTARGNSYYINYAILILIFNNEQIKFYIIQIPDHFQEN